MASQEENKIINYKHLGIVAVCLLIGIILISVGAKSIQPYERIESKQVEVDYTNCTRHGSDNSRCIEYNDTNPECVCHQIFTVNETLLGTVILYYELDSTVQSGSSYVKSRDDQQLSGLLSQEPAEQCDPFRFDDSGRPIAPCGEIADSMFTDNYELRRPRQIPMNVLFYGMLEDKKNYRNPKINESTPLEDVFKDFAKPKSWTQNIWELDTNNTFNNGFENERFIGWMDTSLRRKPAWRLDPSYGGIPNGTYVLRVEYNYPPPKYNGTRKAILVGSEKVIDNSSYGGGVAMVVFGVISLAISLAMAAYIAKVYLEDRNKNERQTNDGLMELNR